MLRITKFRLLKGLVVALIAGVILDWFTLGSLPSTLRFLFLRRTPSGLVDSLYQNYLETSPVVSVRLPNKSSTVTTHTVGAFEQSTFCQSIRCTEESRWLLAEGGIYHSYRTRFGDDDRLILGVTTETGEFSNTDLKTDIPREPSLDKEVIRIEMLLSDKSLVLRDDGSLVQLLEWAGANTTKKALSDYFEQQRDQIRINVPDDIQKEYLVGKVKVRAAQVKMGKLYRFYISFDLLK